MEKGTKRIMGILMSVMALVSIVGGLIFAFFDEPLTMATFWVASAGFKIAESIYNI